MALLEDQSGTTRGAAFCFLKALSARSVTVQIHVGSGVGTGQTTMAAFDAALNKVGIANYNMLRLSSIVPPGSEVILHDGGIPVAMPGKWGDRMYIVMAEKRVDKHNAEAWAGVGWVQDKKTGRGMFTEHEGASESFVRREITQTLEDLMKFRDSEGDFEWTPIQMAVAGSVCADKPVCALAAAVFQVSDWDNKPHFFKETSAKLFTPKSRFWKLNSTKKK